MNNRSILRLITLFFIFIFILINALLWIAHQHFLKEREGEQMSRFFLAGQLIHHSNGNFTNELSTLMIRQSTLAPDLLKSKGHIQERLPFGMLIDYKDRTYFVNMPPPKMDPRFKPRLPPPDFKRMEKIVLEDFKPQSILPFWIVAIAVDILILLFFGYLLRKLYPLHRLKNAIIGYKDGDTSLNVPISGKDEISQITHEFNQVLEKIAAMKEARSLFLRNILHELKTPIMKGSLTTDCLNDSVEQERLKRIFDRMDYLLGEFSKMERFSSGEWKLNLQDYRFVDILDHTCDILICDKNNITIKGEDSALMIRCDFDLFAIAVKNLLDNAFKYSNAKPTVLILSHSIEICSIGDPLPQENRKFDKPFNRAYEDSSAGLGLGLYITYSILQKHGFKLEYHYASGLNCFRIVLNKRYTDTITS
ncbi:ArsS family sensor histidine kinase [Sulfuricurvum sp.]|uniref:ArsS family sensor histidine kinase n=1 Tax=Sulfuricurvum sp. TaxID=2025608 RepID=UPI0026190846|nr:ArsS family sensor histidine kinase [Sulfuricurvum sp.]MDD4883534.1 ArsS family sensor histidine kinase [Sulfuricurvum sp.]